MKDEFEKRLNDRIAKVFDNFEDNSADAGWALLREKYPEKKKRRPVIWFWVGSAAALLLLFLGIGIWDGGNNRKPLKTAARVNREKKIAVDTSLFSTPNKTNITSIEAKTPAPQLAGGKSAGHQRSAIATKTQKTAAIASDKKMSVVANNHPGVQQRVPAVANPSTKTQSINTNDTQGTIAVSNAPTLNNPALANAFADTSAKKNIAQNEVTPVKPLLKSPFTQNDPIIKKDKTVKQDASNKSATFGIYAATYLNYASGSNSMVNLGAGVASDIYVAKNLKFSAGVAVNQNTFNYGNSLPPSNGSIRASAGYTPQLLNFQSNTIAASYAIPVLKNYNAQLTSLDVPLNLKYQFNPQKSSSFISLGISSGTFITETYNSQYGYANSSQQTQNSNTSNFNGFYFAKTLDFSFGLGYSLGKNNLSVEPFFRYPLQGVGTEQIRFGAGGLNLKFNFNNNKR